MENAYSSQISVVICQNVGRRTSEGNYGYNSLDFQNAKTQRAKIVRFYMFCKLEHRLKCRYRQCCAILFCFD